MLTVTPGTATCRSGFDELSKRFANSVFVCIVTPPAASSSTPTP
jgi:hypothetical protein